MNTALSEVRETIKKNKKRILKEDGGNLRE